MAFKKMETPKYTYILYVRQDNEDMAKLKKALNNLTGGAHTEGTKDIIIDFSSTIPIYSTELGAIVIASKRIKTFKRNIIMLVRSDVKKMITSTNIENLKNLIIRENNYDKTAEIPAAAPPEKPEDGIDSDIQQKHISFKTDQNTEHTLTRMRCTECGYVIWVDEYNLNSGQPYCPFKHKMKEE